MAQRPLEHAREVARAAAGVQQHHALQPPAQVGPLSGAEGSILAAARSPVSRALHVRPLDRRGRPDEPDGPDLDTSADGAAPRRIVRAMPPEPFEIMGVVNVTPDSFSDGGE